mmetsp:Transcript_12507/g.14590  ORF Transcript_12507/g.14590 Transcript_12507/m.14590 type:complete len:328 (-) Transcript_12507:949-1932(-)|eukprot:CAMPEP_0184009956 /NCGR_PEP_ID=MMETSP0954-20121128/2919_1 /TAXON_ID=627963 /ORGANISM="Aplanochytrium sp, Strain PBS07" /LENGTH=327 /DNA_ID=CAMNT_0026289439 /DNA_START=128 /DNA_END=1114 /DNA_ORIENTATION=-
MATQFMQQLAEGEHVVAVEQQNLEEEKAKHSSVEAEAEYIRAQKQAENIRQERKLKQQQLKEKELNLALQGVTAATSILANVSTTSALMLGFCGEVLTQMNTSHIDLKNLKYGMWFVAILTMSLLVQSVFMSTICVSKGISLTYYGNNGLYSVKRALRGMMRVRENVDNNFMAGFVGYSLVGLCVIWIKLDQDAPDNLVMQDVWVGFGCTLVWVIALFRMLRAQEETRKLFKFLPKMKEGSYPPLGEETNKFFALNPVLSMSQEHPGYQESRSGYNAIRQDYHLTRMQDVHIQTGKLDLMKKNQERVAELRRLKKSAVSENESSPLI